MPNQFLGTDRVGSLPCMLNDICLTKVVGKGASSTIYLARSHKRKEDFVVKLTLRAKNDRGYDLRYWSEAACLEYLVKERRVYANLHSPFVIKAFLDISPEDDYLCLERAQCSLQALHEDWSEEFPQSDMNWVDIAEPRPGTDRDMLLMHTRPPAEYSRAEFSIGENLIRYIASQWRAGMLYLFYDAKIVNRDIKIGNLLLMPDFRFCIADFGRAETYSEEEARLDLERLGSCIWLLASGQMPYHHHLSRAAIQNLLSAESMNSLDLKSFVLACHDLPAADLVKHRWLEVNVEAMRFSR